MKKKEERKEDLKTKHRKKKKKNNGKSESHTKWSIKSTPQNKAHGHDIPGVATAH